MRDNNDSETGDLLAKGRGRPRKFSEPLSAADKMATRRAKIKITIETQDPAKWSARVCCEAMSNSKFALYQEQAWRRFGELNDFNSGNVLAK